MSLANPNYNPPLGSEGDRLATLAPGNQPPTPEPMARVMVQNGRRYELKVIQQPKRARMCGFGDKDRRPITPPPCVRLIITDVATNKEVDCNDVDHGMFVLIVDLWSKEGNREVNLVRHTSAPTPTMGSSIPMSYADNSPLASGDANLGLENERRVFQFPPQGQRDPMNPHMKPEFSPVGPYAEPPFQQFQQQSPAQAMPYSQAQQQQHMAPSYAQDPYSHQQPQQPQQQAHAPNPNIPPQYQTPQNGYQGGPTPLPMYTTAPIHNIRTQVPPVNMQSAYSTTYDHSPALSYRTQQERPATGMFTRNLIGSLAASAHRLTDSSDFIGIWFVLQDLSVRTEGEFRLRFSFVNVGTPSLQNPPLSSNSPSIPLPPGQSANYINTGKSQVLASCFSEPFMVYSAKKFPGVVESTDLSKVFAMQGIKIPIRKEGGAEGGGKRGGRAEYDEDD